MPSLKRVLVKVTQLVSFDFSHFGLDWQKPSGLRRYFVNTNKMIRLCMRSFRATFQILFWIPKNGENLFYPPESTFLCPNKKYRVGFPEVKLLKPLNDPSQNRWITLCSFIITVDSSREGAKWEYWGKCRFSWLKQASNSSVNKYRAVAGGVCPHVLGKQLDTLHYT